MEVDLPSVSAMSSPTSEAISELELDLGAFELVDSGRLYDLL